MENIEMKDNEFIPRRRNRFLVNIPGMPSYLMKSFECSLHMLSASRFILKDDKLSDLLNFDYTGDDINICLYDERGDVLDTITFTNAHLVSSTIDKMDWGDDDIPTITYYFTFTERKSE